MNPEGIERSPYAIKNANCTSPAWKKESSKTSLNLGINESTKTVRNPHIKKSEVTTINAFV